MTNILTIYPKKQQTTIDNIEEVLKEEEEKLIKMGEKRCRQRRNYHLKKFLSIKEYNPDLLLHKYCMNNMIQPSDYDWLCNELDKKIKIDTT